MRKIVQSDYLRKTTGELFKPTLPSYPIDLDMNKIESLSARPPPKILKITKLP